MHLNPVKVLILNARTLGILCVLMISGLLFVGLWPFDASPKNRAFWIPNEEGLYFDGKDRRFKLSVGGMAYTTSPLASHTQDPWEKGSFTIEITLRPALQINSGVPHILAFVDGSGKEVLYLGQWKQSLIVRWFIHDQSGKRWRKEIGVRDALIKEKRQRLTLVSNRKACSVYVDGERAKSFQDVALIGEKESIRGYSVVLGNSRNVGSSWTGSILALRLYERGLSGQEIARDQGRATESVSREGLIAAFDMAKSHSTWIPDLSGNGNTISVPERVLLNNPILACPDWRNQKDSSPAGDIAVNIFRFAPFGFFFALWQVQAHRASRRRSFFLALLAGALISLAIEVPQAFIPARDSSMVDLICNTGGAVLGAGCLMAGRLVTLRRLEDEKSDLRRLEHAEG